MPKSLLEQPPQIVAQRHQQAERTVESLENHQWARLQPHANPPTTTAPALDCLVYISSATGLATNTKLAYMLENAKRYNRTQKITGVLLFDEGNFMQYLEGPRTSIDGLYERIQRDPLHTGIFEMIRESIDHRMFAEWNMGFKAFNTPKHATLGIITHRYEKQNISPAAPCPLYSCVAATRVLGTQPATKHT